MACAWLLSDNVHPARTKNSNGIDTFFIPSVMVFSVYHLPQLLFFRDVNPLFQKKRQCCKANHTTNISVHKNEKLLVLTFCQMLTISENVPHNRNGS